MAQVASAQTEFEALGATVIAVGPTAPYQAQNLVTGGYPYPLLLDPDHNLGTTLGIGRQSLAQYLFNLAAWLRWVLAFLTIRRQGKITGHYSNLPGTAVVDVSGEVVWVHRGTGLGDHPKVSRILQELRRTISQDQ
ncbi:MAG: redoxin domain-containing protein [Acidimicrobiia bacterium]|nr:redoxin domain-containing protein [Acidimicrobiia bacterium]